MLGGRGKRAETYNKKKGTVVKARAGAGRARAKDKTGARGRETGVLVKMGASKKERTQKLRTKTWSHKDRGPKS